MGRTYAGILGTLALLTVVARGVLHGSSAGSTIPWGVGLMFAFAALGYVLGRIAEQTVGDALKAHFAAERAKLAEEAAAK